jgi:hypothetical protein
VNSHAPMMRQTRISQARRGYGSLPALGSELELCRSPSILLPRHRIFARRNSEGDTMPLEEHGSSTLCLSSRTRGRRQRMVPPLLCGGWRPDGDAFQKKHSRREPSLLYFPCSLSVTRSVLVPRPAARRCSASPLRAPCGSGFPNKKSPCGCGPKYGRDFFFGASAESTSRPWERGTSRRFAQECPEGNPGKYKQGETPWHSTKTT